MPVTKLYIPTEMLEKLKCSLCAGYLSVFPIHIKNSGDESICGRCKVPNDDDYLRDEAYEAIAQFLIFPCSQTKSGCVEQLSPLKLKDHENCCNHRKVDCPSKNYSRCQWQGPNQDLLAHFQNTHTALLLENKQFEIKFNNSIKENMLLSVNEELFVVKKEVDARTATFSCIIEHVVQSETPLTFNYYIRAIGSNQTYFYTFPQKSTSPNSDDKTTKFTAEFLKEHLHEPESFIATVEIVKTDTSDKETVADSISKTVEEPINPNIDFELLTELECPVCLDYMHSPIFQCSNGHSICSFCKPNLVECPLCKSAITNTQNFTLGKLTARLIYPCKYYKSGCRFALRSAEIRNHELSCQYGPYDCPLKEEETCNVKCTKSEILGHIENNHKDFILKSDKINVAFSGADQHIDSSYILKFASRIFKLCFKYAEEKFYWALLLIGPAEDCKLFKFEVDIVDNSPNKLRQYSRGVCTPYGNKDQVFNKRGTYIIFTYDQLFGFITENLTYRIRVIKD